MAEPHIATGLIADSGLELLTWTSANGHRASIFLEELHQVYNLPYTTQSIELPAGVQRAPWYLTLNPTGFIPTLVDHDNDGLVVFECMAILLYLLKKYDKDGLFGFEDEKEQSKMEQWVAWQAATLGPTVISAFYYYRLYPERHLFPLQDFVGKVERFYNVLDNHLANREYVAGSGLGRYSVADMAIFPFFDAMGGVGLDCTAFPNAFKWWERISKRPAVQKGLREPSGQLPYVSYAAMQEEKEKDPKGWEDREGPFRDALKRARKEYGSLE